MLYFKHYVGMARNPKFQALSRKIGVPAGIIYSVWNAMLEYVKEKPEDREAIYQFYKHQPDVRIRQQMSETSGADISGFPCEDYDVFFGYEDGTFRKICDAFEARGMIKNGYILNWNKWQQTGAMPGWVRERLSYEKKKDSKSSLTSGSVSLTRSDAKNRTKDNKEKDIIKKQKTNSIGTYPQKFRNELTGNRILKGRFASLLDHDIAITLIDDLRKLNNTQRDNLAICDEIAFAILHCKPFIESESARHAINKALKVFKNNNPDKPWSVPSGYYESLNSEEGLYNE